jgi:hypothetical protein
MVSSQYNGGKGEIQERDTVLYRGQQGDKREAIGGIVVRSKPKDTNHIDATPMLTRIGTSLAVCKAVISTYTVTSSGISQTTPIWNTTTFPTHGKGEGDSEELAWGRKGLTQVGMTTSTGISYLRA